MHHCEVALCGDTGPGDMTPELFARARFWRHRVLFPPAALLWAFWRTPPPQTLNSRRVSPHVFLRVGDCSCIRGLGPFLGPSIPCSLHLLLRRWFSPAGGPSRTGSEAAQGLALSLGSAGALGALGLSKARDEGGQRIPCLFPGRLLTV